MCRCNLVSSVENQSSPRGSSPLLQQGRFHTPKPRSPCSVSRLCLSGHQDVFLREAGTPPLWTVVRCHRPLLEDLDTLPCVMAATGAWPCGSASCLPASLWSIPGRSQATPGRKNPVLSGSPLLPCGPNVERRPPPRRARCQQAESHCLHTLSCPLP